MSFVLKHRPSFPASILLLAFLVIGPAFLLSGRADASRVIPTRGQPILSVDQNSDTARARVALEEGKTQLASFKIYAALGPLEEALKLFTQAGDQNGIGAAHDALGDLYQREGQYEVALAQFQNAREAFLAKKENGNANLILTKLGETYLLMGKIQEAKDAFAQFGSDAQAGGDRRKTRFAAVIAPFASLACMAGAQNSGNNPNDPPNQGHGPQGPHQTGRMDLRITDEAGNSIRGAKVRLASNRPPGLPSGFSCDCDGITDEGGRYLAPPIHVGPDLKLKISADGFQSFEGPLDQAALSQPVRAILQRKDALSPSRIMSSFAPMASCFELFKMFFGYARSKVGQGRADYMTGQLDAAESDFQDLLAATSLPQVASFKEATRFRVAAATSLGDISFRKGDLVAARNYYKQAIEAARQEGRLDLLWAANAGLGRTLWALSQRSQQTSRLPLDVDRRAAHLSVQADVARLQSESLNAYRESLKNIETIIEGSVRADEARTTFLATTDQVFVEAAGVMAETALATNGNSSTLSGDSMALVAEALKVSEESRARSLLDLLSESGTQITEGVPPELLKRREQNLARQQEIARKLVAVTLTGDAQKQPPAALEAELNSLATEFDSIDNQIRIASPRYSSLVHTQPLVLGQVQQQVLDDKTALLEYCLGDQASYLWVVTRSTVRLFKLPPRAQLEKLAMDFRAQLIPPKLQRRLVGIDVLDDQQRGLGLLQGPSENLPGFVSAANALYRTVVEPAADLLGNQRLLIVADGALNYIPFEALVKTTVGQDYASLNYLVKTNEVVYAPSASVLAAIRQRTKPASGKNLLIVADPVFSAKDSRLQANGDGTTSAETRGLGLGLGSAVSDVAGSSGQTSGGLQLARLTGTRTEADEIAKIARSSGSQADVWVDLNASEDNIRNRDVSNYRVVHVATHGLLNAQRPQFSGLVLSLIGNRTDDGFLRTDEIFNLKLGAPLVILSACETGLGKEKRGEGVIGLTRAFMYAGAPTVGVSLWSVADKSTAELMASFYKGLLGSSTPGSPSLALRDAQLAMISGKKYSAPFYWAPFVLVGDWK